MDATTLSRIASENELVKVIYINKFRSQYLRNNRGQGRKNLRCFPKCSEKSHVERGFCGNSLQIAVVGHGITPEDRVFTQIVSESSTHHLEKPTEGGPITFPPPSCVEELEVKIRLNELYKGTSLTQYTDHVYANDYLCPRRLYEGHLNTCKNGKISLNPKGQVQFTVSPKSWSYAWTSNKHTHKQRHTVRAYFMKFLGYDDDNIRIFKCLGVVDSDPFQVSSSKGAQLSRILNRRNKKFLTAAKAMQQTFERSQVNAGMINNVTASASGTTADASATESLLALTNGLVNLDEEPSYANLPKRHTFTGNVNNYKGIPDMKNKTIVANNRSHLKAAKSRKRSVKGYGSLSHKRARMAKPGTVHQGAGAKRKSKKEIAEFEALQLLTDAIKSFGDGDKLANGYGRNNVARLGTQQQQIQQQQQQMYHQQQQLAMMNGMNPNLALPMPNVWNGNGLNNMTNNSAMQMNLVQSQAGLPGVMPYQNYVPQYGSGLHHPGLIQQQIPGNLMPGYVTLNGYKAIPNMVRGMTSLEQHSLQQQQQQQQEPQQPQIQQQILKGLQAQGFAESLDQRRKPNAGDTVSGMKFPTNNNATVITAKVVGGGPQ